MENIRDWCISRQLWWGHRIPAWYCDDCGEMSVSRTDLTACPKCGGKVHQDEDVLDTWFSSALWPFSTLGWPDQTEDLKYFYPTSMLVTGYDIIFFWVARMIFSGIENMGETPFEKGRYRKTSTSALLTLPKPLTVWIRTNCGKFFKRLQCHTTLPAS